MPKRIYSIQLLRFVAAVMVMFHHAKEKLTYFGGVDVKGFKFGYLAVDIFFIISGFIMVYTTFNRPVNSLKFFLKRVARIFPVYALFTLFAGTIVFVAPRYYAGPADVVFLLKSILFVPAERPEFGGWYPIIVPGWTLSYEFIFYIVFSASLLSMRRYETTILAIFVFFAVCLSVSDYSFAAKVYSGRGGIILEFALGMLLGLMHCNGFRLNKYIAFFLIAAGFYLLVDLNVGNKARLINSGVPAFIICAGAINIQISEKTAVHKIYNYLGALTYPFFLGHMFALQITTRVLLDMGFKRASLNIIFVFLLFLFLSLLLSALVDRFFDRPVQRKLRAMIEAKRTPGIEKTIEAVPQ